MTPTSLVTLEVVDPGLLTSVQDRGRTGWEAFGISQGGALDLYAATWANRLAANPEEAALLEATGSGPTLTISNQLWIASTGAERVIVDGYRYPAWSGFWVSAGSTVSIAGFTGARAYLAVHGGVDVPPVLDSRSTDLESGFGGFKGRALQAGDVIPVGVGESIPYGWLQSLQHPAPPARSSPLQICSVAGPRQDEFAPDALQTLSGAPFRVAPHSNHMGVRLEGRPIPTLSQRGTRVSEPMPIGGLQITPAGQPIALLNARGTVGGYPLLATIVSVHLWRLAQARLGDEIQFSMLSVEEAQSLTRETWTNLARIKPISHPLPVAAGPEYAP